MPEGPEVKRLTVRVNNLVSQHKIKNIKINSGRYTKKLPDGYNKFIENLPLKIEEVKCKGKFIYFVLENNFYIFNTLSF